LAIDDKRVTPRLQDKNKIKTKAKTVNRYTGRRQQQVAMAKSMRSNLDIDRNREGDEAAPVATSDVKTMPKVEKYERGNV
jgi:hypothetical protein